MTGTAMNETENLEILARLNKEQAIIMIPATLIVSITMLVGLVGNSLTCYIYGFRLKRTPTYFFVVMLAIVDLITCAIITPARIVQNVYPLMTTWDGFCKYHMVLSVFTGLCACGFLLAIAVDRYRRFCCPLKTQISTRVAKIIIVSICLFCAVQGGIVTLYYGSVEKLTMYPNVLIHTCSAKVPKKVNYYQLGCFTFYMIVAIFGMITLVTLYSIVLCSMKQIVNKNKKIARSPRSKVETQHQRQSNSVVELKSRTDPGSSSTDGTTTTYVRCIIPNIQEESVSSLKRVELNSFSDISSGTSPCKSSESHNEVDKQEARTRSLNRAEDNMKRLNRTTVTMMMITAVFFVTYIPSILAMVVNATGIAEKEMGIAAAIFYWLARHSFYIGSCLNPVIYGYRNQNFMGEVRQLFRRFR